MSGASWERAAILRYHAPIVNTWRQCVALCDSLPCDRLKKMGKYCCVVGCKSRSHDHKNMPLNNGIRYFCFPTVKKNQGPKVEEITKRRRMAWIASVRRSEITFDNIAAHRVVCDRHFHTGKPAYEMMETDPDWVPSLHMGHTEMKTTNTGRFNRCQEREKARQEAEMVKATALQEEEALVHEAQLQADASATATVATQTDLTGTDMPQFDAGHLRLMQEEINRLAEENHRLKKELQDKELTEESFKEDDTKVRYFTGLPSFSAFLVLIQEMLPHLPQDSRRVLSSFQMLLICLMRMRLNLPVQYLAYLYGVSRDTVAKVFKETISILYVRISPLVVWPDRETLRTTMPHQFVETFGNRVAVIIDCFEIFIERPSNLKAKAQTFSHYKHNNTMKYLIGITPKGGISYISKGWGGRTSDKHITENSGFLNNLVPGDMVLADRGFDIQESVGMMCAEVKIPAFSRGMMQMQAKDIEDTRELAHLRIHVERVIGNVCGKYTILTDTIPISMVLPCEGEEVTFLDKIVTVCCALTNMCPGVV